MKVEKVVIVCLEKEELEGVEMAFNTLNELYNTFVENGMEDTYNIRDIVYRLHELLKSNPSGMF